MECVSHLPYYVHEASCLVVATDQFTTYTEVLLYKGSNLPIGSSGRAASGGGGEDAEWGRWRERRWLFSQKKAVWVRSVRSGELDSFFLEGGWGFQQIEKQVAKRVKTPALSKQRCRRSRERRKRKKRWRNRKRKRTKRRRRRRRRRRMLFGWIVALWHRCHQQRERE